MGAPSEVGPNRQRAVAGRSGGPNVASYRTAAGGPDGEPSQVVGTASHESHSLFATEKGTVAPHGLRHQVCHQHDACTRSAERHAPNRCSGGEGNILGTNAAGLRVERHRHGRTTRIDSGHVPRGVRDFTGFFEACDISPPGPTRAHLQVTAPSRAAEADCDRTPMSSVPLCRLNLS